MVDMKEKDFEKMLANFEKMQFKADGWWPSVDDIKTYIEPHIKSNIEFVIWITETAKEPETDEEKASKKMLYKLLYKNFVIDYDD